MTRTATPTARTQRTATTGSSPKPSEAVSHPAMSWAPVALVALMPLAWLPWAFGPFHVVKWLVALVVVPAGLAVCAWRASLRWPRARWFAAWIAVSFAAAVLGVAPLMSLLGSPGRNAGIISVLLGAGAFVLGASSGGQGIVQRRVLRAAFLAAGVVGLLAVAERLGLDMFGFGDLAQASRARSSWGSATFAGAHLALMLPVAAAHTRSKDPRWRGVALVATSSIVAGLVATGTRAAWLAAAVAVVLMASAWRSQWGSNGSGARRQGRQSRSIPRWARWAALAVIVAVAAALMVPELGRSSAVGRVDQWRTAAPLVTERPLLGSGPDTQRVVLPAGIDAPFETEHGSEELHDRAHSLPLDTLVTTGLLGLLALGGLLVMLGRDIVANLNRRLMPTAVASGLAAYLVTLLFGFGDPAIDPLPWMLAGLLVAAIVPRGRSEQGESDGSGGIRPVPSTPAARKVSTAAFATIALLGFLWAGGEALADIRLDSAIENRDAGNYAEALDDLESASATAPARFDLHQIAARMVVESLTTGPDPTSWGSTPEAAAQDAFDRLDRAERIAGDDPDLLMDRAELLAASGDPRAARDAYDRVFDAYPESFRAHLGAGLVFAQLNLVEEAESAWQRAASLGPKDPRALVNLGILYERSGEPELSRDAYEAALEVEPSSQEAAAGLARVTG